MARRLKGGATVSTRQESLNRLALTLAVWDIYLLGLMWRKSLVTFNVILISIPISDWRWWTFFKNMKQSGDKLVLLSIIGYVSSNWVHLQVGTVYIRVCTCTVCRIHSWRIVKSNPMNTYECILYSTIYTLPV